MSLGFKKLIHGAKVIHQNGGYGFYKLDANADPLIYGVRIDLNNSDPTTSVEYTDDAVNFECSYMDFTNKKFEYGSWKNKFPFNLVRPCLLKGGKVVTYLNPDNYYEDIFENEVNLNGNSGDVMIEVPKIYYYMYNDDNYQYLKISNVKIDDNYCCLAHTYNAVENDKVYLSVYHVDTSGKSFSDLTQPGQTPYHHSMSTRNSSPNNWLQNGGLSSKKYLCMPYHMTNLLRLLFILQFKTLDMVSALGSGFTGYTNYGMSYHEACGTLNEKGMYWGTKTATNKNDPTVSSTLKFMGMENPWSNWGTVVFGITIASTTKYNVLDVTQTGTTWKTLLDEYGVASGYIKQIYGTNEQGFFAKETGGSASTYYCASGLGAGTTTDNKVMWATGKGMMGLSQQKSTTQYDTTGCRVVYYPQSY